MKIVIDSSVYISHFGNADYFTEKSKGFFRRLASSNCNIIAPSLVVAETMVVLGKQKDNNLPEIYKFIMALQVEPLDRQFLDLVKNKIAEYNPALKTADFLIALTAKQHSAVLLTWDKRLLSQGKSICEVMTPEEFVESI